MGVRSDGPVVSAALALPVAAPDGARGSPSVAESWPLLRLTVRALLVGLVCFVGTETVASNRPPVFVSPIWPTNAILLCALVVAPSRDWWAYALAGFFSSVNHNVHRGAPAVEVGAFLAADVIEVFVAAVGVRRFAGGLDAFESPRNLVPYLIVVAVAAFVSSFVSSLAAATGSYWALWRSWFLGDTFGYVTLAPAILTWLGSPRPMPWSASGPRNIEAGLLGAGLLLTCARVFTWPAATDIHSPGLIYLPLPFLLWAAARFG